jgi:hypothetical protein
MTIKSKTEFSLTSFISEVRSTGMARPTHFEVEIVEPECIFRNRGKARIVSLFCKTASLPQSRINTSRLQIAGPPIYRPIGVDYGGDNLTLGFYVDSKLNIKTFFDEWIDGMVGRQTGTHQYSSYYQTSLKIKQLDVQQRAVYVANFQDVFPVSVNPLMLDHNSTGQVHELTVTFNYRRWSYETLDYSTVPEESSQSQASIDKTQPKTDQQRGPKTNNRNPNRNRSIRSQSWKSNA